MDWFLYDNGLRQERVKHFCLSDKKTTTKLVMSPPLIMKNQKPLRATILTTRDIMKYRNSRQVMFLGKGLLKICSKFTGEYPCRSAI